MSVSVSVENDTKTINVLPWPESHTEFLLSTNVIDEDSLKILWSKHYFGINHRTHMFMVLYNTFVEIMNNKSTIDDELTIQTLYCDMILRLGTILEDFAGMCKACQEFSLHDTSIASYFLAFSDPMGFYNSVAERAHRQIKQIFRYPQSKGNLDRIFNELTNEERELLWKGIGLSTEIIQDCLADISKAIKREVTSNVTYYDLYNKLKHGFSPIYPYVIPAPFEIRNVPSEIDDEEIIKNYLFESISIMHDKTPGQRTEEEAERFRTFQQATPTITFDPVTFDSANSMKDIVEKIEYLYKYLVNIYLSYSQGSKKFSLKLREGMLTEDEENQILSIIENESRYIVDNANTY